MITLRQQTTVFSTRTLHIAIIGVLVWVSGAPVFAAPLSRGTDAPGFSCRDIDGVERSSVALRGKVILLGFWMRYCSACAASFPGLEKVYEEFKSQGLEVVVESTEDKARLEGLKAQLHLSFPLISDTSENECGIFQQYHPRLWDAVYLINREGVITHYIDGARDWDNPDARDFLKKLLAAH